MKFKKVTEHVLVITSHQNIWTYIWLIFVIFVCWLCGIEFLKEGINVIPFIGCMVISISWVWFAYYASNAEVVLDKINSQFIFRSTSFFGKKEEYKCPLDEVCEIVLERELDSGEGLTCYRIGFVTNNGTKYPSKIFSGDFNSSVKKAYAKIRRHISEETNDEC